MLEKTKLPFLKVIAIDDDPFFLDILDFTIKDISDKENVPIYQLTYCDATEKATQELQKEHFHLIILDIKMPFEDGLSWLSRTRKEQNHTPPTVVISSSTLESDIYRAYSLNVAGYMTKTGFYLSLREKIKAILFFYVKACEKPPNPF